MRWYVSKHGETKGPFDKTDIIAAITAGQIGPDDTVCQEGTEDWLPVRELGAFAAAVPLKPMEAVVPAAVEPAARAPSVQREALSRRSATGGPNGILWIDRSEKVGRLVLWLVLAAAVLLVPVEYIKQRRVEAELRETVRKEEIQRARTEKERAERSERLSFDSFKPALRFLDNATGRLWFSNVSNRTGVVCVAGVATNPNTKMSTESLPACKVVTAYASNIELAVMFAGGDLRVICKDVTCDLAFKEVPDVK
jgi:hypothetical protein